MNKRLIDTKITNVEDVTIKQHIAALSVFNRALFSPTKTIKVSARVWSALKGLKKANETFDDVIMGLLNKKTQTVGNENIKAISFKRKIDFFSLSLPEKGELGIEFEYNDAKSNKNDFILDVKIKKVFAGRRSFNPSEFFGVDNAHKHFSEPFIVVYLKSVVVALKKEFRIEFTDLERIDQIARWRRFYYEYSLSEESFKEDIEEPLRLSAEEKITPEWEDKMKKSFFYKWSL